MMDVWEAVDTCNLSNAIARAQSLAFLKSSIPVPRWDQNIRNWFRYSFICQGTSAWRQRSDFD